MSGSLKKTASCTRKLKDNEEKYLALMDHLPVGVYRTTMDGRIVEANTAIVKMLGFDSRAEMLNANVRSLYVNAHERDKHLGSLDSRKSEFAEFRLKRKDGTTIWGRDYCRASRGRDGRIRHYDGILVDISGEKKSEKNLKKAMQKLESLSLQDDMTGLYNRRGFFMIAGSHVELAQRRKSMLFLLFMDLDDLKGINDRWGHGRGDEAIVDLAGILNRTFRKSDIRARIGGDEFAVFPVGSSYDGVGLALRRLEENIDAFNRMETRPFKISVSTGISVYDPQSPCSLDELIRRADVGMYAKKSQKKVGKRP
jgi:diguanylate cyclase (GGDEF)-like protein/PAS domain S-box-containing protein